MVILSWPCCDESFEKVGEDTGFVGRETRQRLGHGSLSGAVHIFHKRLALRGEADQSVARIVGVGLAFDQSIIEQLGRQPASPGAVDADRIADLGDRHPVLGIFEGIEIPEAGGAGWRDGNGITVRRRAMQAARLLAAADAHERPFDHVLRLALRHDCNHTTVVS